jgi:hypothetical protein
VTTTEIKKIKKRMEQLQQVQCIQELILPVQSTLEQKQGRYKSALIYILIYTFDLTLFFGNIPAVGVETNDHYVSW